MKTTLQLSRRPAPVQQESLHPAFARLLLYYEDQAGRMEAYYRDSSVNREVRKERLREAFGINRTEARYLSRLYEATTEKPLR